MEKKPPTTAEQSIPIPIPDTSDLEKLRVEPLSFREFEAEARELIAHAAESTGVIKKVALLLSRGVSGTTIPWLVGIFDGINIPATFNEWANSVGGYEPYGYEPPQLTAAEFAAYLINKQWPYCSLDDIAEQISKHHPDDDTGTAMREGYLLIAVPDAVLRDQILRWCGIKATEDDDAWDMGPPSTPPDIRQLKYAGAVEAMMAWFYENFEDPVEHTPFDEGEYVCIWGGPCDAREELEAAFGSAASERAITAAVERIEADGTMEWVPSQTRMRPE